MSSKIEVRSIYDGDFCGPYDTTVGYKYKNIFEFVDRYIENNISSLYGNFVELNLPTKKYLPDIKNVIFNKPATIVFWEDGSKTVVKCDKEKYDPEKGLVMAIAKKALSNKGNYYEVIKKWVGDLMPGGEDSCKKARKAEAKKSKNKK